MPAAAVIPAPIAYIKVVAVKKFVVEFLGPGGGRPCGCTSCPGAHALRGVPAAFTGGCGFPPRINYCEQIRVFKAGRTA